MRVYSKIRLVITNEHIAVKADGTYTEAYTINPGQFQDNVPEWVTTHPLWAAATRDYVDGSGIEREADVLVIDDPAAFSVPRVNVTRLDPVSGTNVSENPQAGKALKGASKRGQDFSATPSPAAVVDEELTDGAK